jgi:hypothetical protein
MVVLALLNLAILKKVVPLRLFHAMIMMPAPSTDVMTTLDVPTKPLIVMITTHVLLINALLKKDVIMKLMNANTLMLVILFLVILYMDVGPKKLNAMIRMNVPPTLVILTVRKQALVNM